MVHPVEKIDRKKKDQVLSTWSFQRSSGKRLGQGACPSVPLPICLLNKFKKYDTIFIESSDDLITNRQRHFVSASGFVG
jgi:hypothetical protein